MQFIGDAEQICLWKKVMNADESIWLSVLVPVYNVQEFVRDCIESIVLANDTDGIEIIMLDDCSTDDSRAAAEILCETYGCVRLIFNSRNVGLSAARNKLIDASRGEFIWFLDSDDMLLPGAVDRLRGIALGPAPDIILCDYQMKSSVRKRTFKGPSGKLGTERRALVRGIFAFRKMHSWSKISRRRLWSDDLRFPVGKCFEDIATTPWLLLRATSFYYIAEPWVFYRSRPGSIMAMVAKSPKMFDRAKNDDLAEALLGFWQFFEQELGPLDRRTRYYIGHFCGKEYTKIAARLIRANLGRGYAGLRDELGRYLAITQQCSPLSFRKLGGEYLRRLRIDRWLHLHLLMLPAHKAKR